MRQTPDQLMIEPHQLCEAEKEHPWGTVTCERRQPHVGPHYSLDTPHPKGVASWGSEAADD